MAALLSLRPGPFAAPTRPAGLRHTGLRLLAPRRGGLGRPLASPPVAPPPPCVAPARRDAAPSDDHGTPASPPRPGTGSKHALIVCALVPAAIFAIMGDPWMACILILAAINVHVTWGW